MSVYPPPPPPPPIHNDCVYTLVNPAPPHCGCSGEEPVASCAGELRSPCSQRQLFVQCCTCRVPRCQSSFFFAVLPSLLYRRCLPMYRCCFTSTHFAVLPSRPAVSVTCTHSAILTSRPAAGAPSPKRTLLFYRVGLLCPSPARTGKVCAITGRLRMSMDGNNNLFLFFFFFNLLTAPPRKFSGMKSAPIPAGNSILDGPITTLLLILCFLVKVLSRVQAKRP